MRLLVLVPIAFVLAACGGGGSSTKSNTSVSVPVAIDKTLAQQSEKVALTATVNVQGQSVSITGDGAFSATKGELHLSFQLPLLGASTLDERVIGTDVWISSPLLAAALKGKHWLKFEIGKPANVAGFNLSPLLVAQSPSSLLRNLKGATDAKNLGSETIDGVSTTHFQVTVGSSTEDVWVDDQSLIRRLSRDFSLPKGGNNTVTMTFSDFGTAVQVTPPPASDVGTVTK